MLYRDHSDVQLELCLKSLIVQGIMCAWREQLLSLWLATPGVSVNIHYIFISMTTLTTKLNKEAHVS